MGTHRVDKIEHVAVTVADVRRARAFYEGVLGLREVPRPESFDFPGAWYRLGNLDLHVIGRDQTDPPSRRHFALWVQDIRATADALKNAGCPVLWEHKYKIRDIDRFFTEDPDGNRIEVMGPDVGMT